MREKCASMCPERPMLWCSAAGVWPNGFAPSCTGRTMQPNVRERLGRLRRCAGRTRHCHKGIRLEEADNQGSERLTEVALIEANHDITKLNDSG